MLYQSTVEKLTSSPIKRCSQNMSLKAFQFNILLLPSSESNHKVYRKKLVRLTSPFLHCHTPRKMRMLDLIRRVISGLRTVPTFATAHTFCPSSDGSRKSDFLSAMAGKTEIFLCGL